MSGKRDLSYLKILRWRKCRAQGRAISNFRCRDCDFGYIAIPCGKSQDRGIAKKLQNCLHRKIGTVAEKSPIKSQKSQKILSKTKGCFDSKYESQSGWKLDAGDTAWSFIESAFFCVYAINRNGLESSIVSQFFEKVASHLRLITISPVLVEPLSTAASFWRKRQLLPVLSLLLALKAVITLW